jgi:hypothetical protein
MLDGPVSLIVSENGMMRLPRWRQHRLQGERIGKNVLDRKRVTLDVSFAWHATSPSEVLPFTAKERLATLAAKKRPLLMGI